MNNKQLLKYSFCVTISIIVLMPIFFGVSGATLAQAIERKVMPFERIRVSTGIDLFLRQEDEEKLSIDADDNLADIIQTAVIGKELQIFVVERTRWPRGQIPKVYVSFKNIKKLTVKSGADIFSLGDIKLSYLKLDSDGGSDIYMNINVDSLYVNTKGGSNVKLRGVAHRMTANACGGSDLNAKELITQYILIETMEGSDAVLNVSESLNAKTSGGSDIFYYGNPKVINIFQKGSGEVKER